MEVDAVLLLSLLFLAIIEPIVNDRVPQVMSQLAPDLMFPASQQLHPHQVIPEHIGNLPLLQNYIGGLGQLRSVITIDFLRYLSLVFVVIPLQMT